MLAILSAVNYTFGDIVLLLLPGTLGEMLKTILVFSIRASVLPILIDKKNPTNTAQMINSYMMYKDQSCTESNKQ